jgi:hypothetical protein
MGRIRDRLATPDNPSGLDVGSRRHEVRGHGTGRDSDLPAIGGNVDPRIVPTRTGAPRLVALQRAAGNRAVASLVGHPTVQRMDVQIDELTSQVRTTDDMASRMPPEVLARLIRAVMDRISSDRTTRERSDEERRLTGSPGG